MSKRSKLLGSYNSFKPQNKFTAKLVKGVKFVIVFFLTYQFLSVFFITPFIVNTSAMEPGIIQGEKILSAPIVSGASLTLFNLKVPGFKKPERGDIVLVKPGNADKLSWYIALPDSLIRFFTLQKKSIDPNRNKNWNNQLSIKRIIGIPGDTVRMENYRYLIKPANKTDFISEEELFAKEYLITIPESITGLDSTFPFSGNMPNITLEENHYWVSNDNRGASYDSRLYGSIPRNSISGPVFLSYWPEFHLH